ncbi:MAG TPA: DUF4124 domain-containing protein [Gammaproteobacteria bacterium]|mgnify:CR=1 FL=1|nr:DUF4124 domain-containing protein [Gammaproteobacteria bacterium]HOP16977.1 DUF4124 domain-containing protein [Gammaproteobacteria bacterium]HPQ25810.1 DUF4124 domain-containing protein [Gammaproteobacteria bacterium]
MRWSFYILCTLVLLGGDATAARIYRCDGSQGEPAFSQTPCGGTTESTHVAAPSRRSPATGLRAGERAWLRARQDSRGGRSKARTAVGAGGVERQKAAEKQAYQCLRKRRALDTLNARLRAGYKAGRGARLHQRRQSYEDYLAAFCS